MSENTYEEYLPTIKEIPMTDIPESNEVDPKQVVAAVSILVAVDTCLHCGDLVIAIGDTNWTHYRGRQSYLTRCQHTVPYGYDATPKNDGKYTRMGGESGVDSADGGSDQRSEDDEPRGGIVVDGLYVFDDYDAVEEAGEDPTPREEFESQFGEIDDEQWQWLKEFAQRNDGSGSKSSSQRNDDGGSSHPR